MHHVVFPNQPLAAVKPYKSISTLYVSEYLTPRYAARTHQSLHVPQHYRLLSLKSSSMPSKHPPRTLKLTHAIHPLNHTSLKPILHHSRPPINYDFSNPTPHQPIPPYNILLHHSSPKKKVQSCAIIKSYKIVSIYYIYLPSETKVNVHRTATQRANQGRPPKWDA